MRTLLTITAAFIAIVLSGSAGCTDRSDSAPNGAAAPERFTIVTTVGMITDLARGVAGDRAEVIALIGPGVDPHLYKPTRSDVRRLLDADIIFYNGLLLEGKMIDSLVRAATSGRKVHAVTELLDEAYLIEPDGYEGHADPHVWMDPAAWARAVDVVRDALIEFDPSGEEQYRANALALAKEIEELDAYAVKTLAGVQEDRRVLVTAHDAFNYFGRRFGFEVVGIQGISTESEAGVYDIERLVNLLVDRRVPAVFVESTVNERSIRALVSGAAARGHDVTIGGSLFSDAMGDPGTYEGTYVGMIDHNVTTIARALGAETPPAGMSGRLSEAVGQTP